MAKQQAAPARSTCRFLYATHNISVTLPLAMPMTHALYHPAVQSDSDFGPLFSSLPLSGALRPRVQHTCDMHERKARAVFERVSSESHAPPRPPPVTISRGIGAPRLWQRRSHPQTILLLGIRRSHRSWLHPSRWDRLLLLLLLLLRLRPIPQRRPATRLRRHSLGRCRFGLRLRRCLSAFVGAKRPHHTGRIVIGEQSP